MKNKIEDLRNHLFATIEGLLDEEKPLDIERAKAVAHVSSVIIESAKVEVKALEIIGARAAAEAHSCRSARRTRSERAGAYSSSLSRGRASGTRWPDAGQRGMGHCRRSPA